MKSTTTPQSLPEVDDDELAKRVTYVLSANRSGCGKINVGAVAGTVRLSGSVRTFFLRQMAIALAKRVVGVRQIVDDLQVELEPMQSS